MAWLALQEELKVMMVLGDESHRVFEVAHKHVASEDYQISPFQVVHPYLLLN